MYVVDIHINHFSEIILISIHNICFIRESKKKKKSVLTIDSLLSPEKFAGDQHLNKSMADKVNNLYTIYLILITFIHYLAPYVRQVQ